MELEKQMTALQGGESGALAAIYDLTRGAVYAAAFTVLRNHFFAEDIMQETYLTVYRKIALYRPNGTAKAWICRIARNLALDEKRRQKREVSFSFYEDIPDSAESPDTGREFDDLIETAKRVLNKKELEVVLLHTVGDLEYTEIAKIIKRSYATVRWQYAEAVKKLKKYQSKEDFV